MENLFDLLIPAIFIIGSIFVNQMVKKGRNEESSESSVDDDIREVVRKQIELRRLQQQQGTNAQQRPVSQMQTPPVVYQRPPERPKPEPRPVQENRYDTMRHQLEEMRSKAEIEKRKAASILKGKGAMMKRHHVPLQHSGGKGLIGEVIRELHHPTSARKAIINMEILGPPVGLRRPGQVHASWEQ